MLPRPYGAMLVNQDRSTLKSTKSTNAAQHGRLCCTG